MQVPEAARRALLGEPLTELAATYRAGLLAAVGLDPKDASPTTFEREARRFVSKVCRHLSERHAEASHVAVALRDYVNQVDDYDAFDSLLATFPAFEGRDAVLRRGRALFPRALTAHWNDD
jgi:hypothetical protein